MISIERTHIYGGRNVAPDPPPCQHGWVPVTECRLQNYVRPATAYVVNMPITMLAKGAARLGDVAARLTPGGDRTARRFEAVAAVMGALLTPTQALVHPSGKPRDIAMKETFKAGAQGSQHRTAVVLEVVPDSSAHAYALRIWLLCIDPYYSCCRHVGLQLAHTALLERTRVCTVPSRPGTAKRKREDADEEAAKAESDVPNPLTARSRLCSPTDWIAALHSYAGMQPLACGALQQQLRRGVGSATAVELLDASKAGSPGPEGPREQYQNHVASPEVTLTLSAQTLACGLGANVSPRHLSMQRYVSQASNGLTFPTPSACWMLVPSGRADGMSMPFPPALKSIVASVHARLGSGGELHSSQPLFEALSTQPMGALSNGGSAEM